MAAIQGSSSSSMAAIQGSSSSSADFPDNEGPDAQDVARRAVAREVANWKAKEAERIELRQRPKLIVNGRAAMNIPRAAGRPARYNEKDLPAFNTRQAANDPLPSNAGGTALTRPTYTRMARRHIYIETLNQYKLDFTIDEDPDYVLIRRWVSEPEADELFAHTKSIRDQRPQEGEISTRTREATRLGKMGSGPMPPQQSTAMGTLNTPLGTPSQQVNIPEPPQVNPNAPFGQTLGPRFMQGNQRQAAPGNAVTSASALSSSNQFSSFTGKRSGPTFAPASSTGRGGLRIESSLSSTISRDNVMGEEARNAVLLAQFGKKQFSLAFRSPQPQDEATDVDEEKIDQDLSDALPAVAPPMEMAAAYQAGKNDVDEFQLVLKRKVFFQPQ